MQDFREKNELRKELQSVSSSIEWLVSVPDMLDAYIVERNFDKAVGMNSHFSCLTHNIISATLTTNNACRGRRADEKVVERQ